jgi:hypothetical protein
MVDDDVDKAEGGFGGYVDDCVVGLVVGHLLSLHE